MAEEFDPMQLYEGLVQALRKPERTPGEGGYVPRSPMPYEYIPSPRTGSAPHFWGSERLAGVQQSLAMWLAEALRDYYAGRIGPSGREATPQAVVDHIQRRRKLGLPRTPFPPGFEDEVLRYMGFRRMPDGSIEPISEEAKPPMG